MTSRYASKKLASLEALCGSRGIVFAQGADEEVLITLLEENDLVYERNESNRKAQAEREKAEMEERKRARAAEAARDQAEAEERDKIREQERYKIDKENELILAGKKSATAENANEVNKSNGPDITKITIAEFDEKTDISVYLDYFEKVMGVHLIGKDLWTKVLSRNLKGKAQDIFARIPVEDLKDYEKVKAALLLRFSI